MSTRVQLRRGTTTEHATFTGAVGEVTVDTTKNVVVVHDGVTAGGHPAGGSSSPNIVINGNFNVNQDGKSGTVTLSAGAYGHDMWKAGANGCTYAFAKSENITTLTISAGSLIQIIEGVNLQSRTVCLSWAGTAQGKIGAGSYSASGVTGTATGGTNLNIEFNTGTLSKVQLNYGLVALPFVAATFSDELRACMVYYEKSYAYGTAPGTANASAGLYFTGAFNTATAKASRWPLGSHPFFSVVKRAAPTVTLYTYTGVSGQWDVPSGAPKASAASASERGFFVTNATGSSVTPPQGEAFGHWVADARM